MLFLRTALTNIFHHKMDISTINTHTHTHIYIYICSCFVDVFNKPGQNLLVHEGLLSLNFSEC